MGTGEKFTFVRKGPVHLDCLVSSKRKEITEEKVQELKLLSSVLESELQHLVNLLSRKADDEKLDTVIKNKIKEMEKASGETTRLIFEL